MKKKPLPELNTCPTFVFEQLGEDDLPTETPIEIIFWNGNIELRQRGNGYVLIQTDEFERLFKAIKQHLPEALSVLKKR